MAFETSANPACPAILSVAEREAGMTDQQFHNSDQYGHRNKRETLQGPLMAHFRLCLITLHRHHASEL
jgi:hypothetical protein